MSDDEIEELMSEVPHGPFHGRKAGDLSYVERHDMDGLIWPRESRDLSQDISQDFRNYSLGVESTFHVKSGWEHGVVAHRGLLTEDEIMCLDTDNTRKLLEEEWEVPRGSIARAYDHRGTISERDRLIRDELDEKILQSVESGVSSNSIALALGWKVTRTNNKTSCQRMERLLARARDSREFNRG